MPFENTEEYFAYLEAMGKEPLSYKEPEKKEDTRPEYEDSRSGRSLRAVGQRAVENSFEKQKGMSAIERCIDIRENLFHSFKSLHGERPEKPREVLVSNSLILFPEDDLVQTELLPGYTKLLDSLYDDCLETKDPTERSARGKRLAATAYTLGILIHPYTDGNGQTMRLLAMSYLKEFCPEYKDKEFRFKLGSGGKLASLALIKEATFEETFYRESIELRDYDVLKEVKDLLPSYQEGIPFSLSGLKAFFMLKKINPELKTPKAAHEFFLERNAYLQEHLGNNVLFTKRQAKEKLEEIAKLKSGFVYPTLNKEGVVRLNIASHEHERVYHEIVNLFGDSSPEPIYFSNALSVLSQQEKLLRDSLSSKENDRIKTQQQELEDFLKNAVSPRGSSLIRRFLRGTVLPHEKDATLISILDTFISDITTNKDNFLEDSEEHKRYYRQHVID